MIAAVHSACVGGGVDLITATDVRLCTKDAWFQVKEVEMGKLWEKGLKSVDLMLYTWFCRIGG